MSGYSTPIELGDISEGFYDILDSRNDLASAHVELESLLNATDSLEALLLHLDSHQIVSQEHRNSIVVSFENLLGSSGIGVSDIIPELDGHIEGTVSTESLKDKLVSLWKRLVASILSILGTLKRFWNRVASFRGRLRMHAEHLAKLGSVKKLSVIKHPEVNMGIEIKSFMQGDKPIYDPDSMIRALAAALDQYKTFNSIYIPEMIKIGSDFDRILSSNRQGEEALLETCSLFEKMPIMKTAAKLRALAYNDPRFGNRLTFAAPAMIGGWTLFFVMLKHEQVDAKYDNLTSYSMALRTTGVKFAYSSAGGMNLNGGNLKTAHGAQVQSLALRVIDILDEVEAQEKFALSNKIENRVKDILRSGERYQSRISDSTGFDQSVIRFVRNYASWAIGPSDQIATNLLSVSRSILMYCKKSINEN